MGIGGRALEEILDKAKNRHYRIHNPKFHEILFWDHFLHGAYIPAIYNLLRWLFSLHALWHLKLYMKLHVILVSTTLTSISLKVRKFWNQRYMLLSLETKQLKLDVKIHTYTFMCMQQQTLASSTTESMKEWAEMVRFVVLVWFEHTWTISSACFAFVCLSLNTCNLWEVGKFSSAKHAASFFSNI